MFAVALSAAAFGLVRVVHNNLVDRIQETQQTQIDQLERDVRNGELATQNNQNNPQGQLTCYPAAPGKLLCFPGGPPPERDGYLEQRRQIQQAGQTVTLVADRSVAEVNTTVDNLTTLMWFAVPALVLLVAFAVWYFAGRALRPVELIRAEAAAITGSTIHRRVPEPVPTTRSGGSRAR